MIAQPPPTPGLASWAFNSVFNRETPSSKYANMKNKRDEINQYQNDYRIGQTTSRPIAGRSNDDTILSMSSRKNVAWGGEDFKVRSRSSSFSERPIPKRFVDDNGSIHNRRDTDFFKENELLPDDYSEYNTFTKKKKFDISPPKRNSRFNSALPKLNEPLKPIPNVNDYLTEKKTSLPETYPGKFPSPYVTKNSSFDSNDILSSSANRNFEKARSNTILNRFENNQSIPSFRIPSQQQQQQQPPITRNSRPRSSYRERLSAMAAPRYKETLRYDEQMLLDSMDENIAELDDITKHVSHLKLQKNNEEDFQGKYLEIRQELIQELKKSKKLYDSYYQFVDKYKELKRKYKETANDDSRIQILQKEIFYLKTNNELLTKKLKDRDNKFLDNDTTINDLKRTLTNSSNFEATLRRKINYLEDKIEKQELEHKSEKFELNQKNFMLETKLKDDEELYQSKLRKAYERIRDLEGQLEKKAKSQEPRNISIIPEYTTKDNYKQNRYAQQAPYSDENDDTYQLLHKKYGDKKIESSRYSPEKRYSTGNMFADRPSYKQYNDIDQDLFKNFDKNDESTNNEDYFAKHRSNGQLRSNSLRSSSNRHFPSSKRYSNPNLSSLELNTSEIG
ncbi:hypothetical protein BN7_649 [Wickerhamomyces ciferrii]|uniref:Spindle pole body component Bbp1 C-terminal domain-containing protein n=1 Tax=Wickerhamomyces ciferrii (strain ATCC 14091 / BCRC 22168 / CBS 111 / JCM 3599 / NBRC 0793 / NRRL Y-1031 F-60-10) TaxID=1206466 RepID=K0KFW3_WICCF|nr:uncharacterized protein BN7_649 [Wickerhamomyces ciferrii]CCH41112.1 hypothetical protein BN7_649 [Wickerhamomyces ciferrii]